MVVGRCSTLSASVSRRLVYATLVVVRSNIAMLGGRMIDYARGSDPLTGITAASALRWDAERLRAAMLEAVRTSPDCFLMTEESVKARPPDSWIDEIRSSTWAVAQQ